MKEQISNIPGWELKENRLVRQIRSKDFKSALLLINAVAYAAEKMNHHPKIENVYRSTTFTLWTHDSDSLTEKDFALARAINDLIDG